MRTELRRLLASVSLCCALAAAGCRVEVRLDDGVATPDAGTPDAGTPDASADGAADAGPDGLGAPIDAGPDAPLDAAPDGGIADALGTRVSPM